MPSTSYKSSESSTLSITSYKPSSSSCSQGWEKLRLDTEAKEAVELLDDDDDDEQDAFAALHRVIWPEAGVVLKYVVAEQWRPKSQNFVTCMT